MRVCSGAYLAKKTLHFRPYVVTSKCPMRSILNRLLNLLGFGGGPAAGKKSKLMGMYLSEANELSRTQFEVRRNRERQHGKSFSNRERA